MKPKDQLSAVLFTVGFCGAGFGIYRLLPPAWQAHWLWYGPEIGPLALWLIARHLSGGEPYRNEEGLRRGRIKQSVNPPWRRL
ncbi:MAG TPA: hypothetical protein VG944_04255 [Fimbriimonas sp.]|nr:hypothetical protein [Fimbriimonas sp.]